MYATTSQAGCADVVVRVGDDDQAGGGAASRLVDVVDVPSVGLSLCSNLTDGAEEADYLLSAAVGGSLLMVAKERQGKGLQVGGGVRQKCSGFSRRSRGAMLQRFAKLKRDEVAAALFLTLTYPRVFPSARESKVHLDAMLKRLLRKYPDAGVIWKLEAQRRGAPHYHLVVLGVKYIDPTWLGQAWFDVVGSGDLGHRKAGTQVKRVMSHRHALGYITKYVAKVEEPDEAFSEVWKDAGRYWGCVGKWREYLAPMMLRWLHRDQVAKLARVLDRRRLSQARQRRKGRAGAIAAARRRRALDFRLLWYGSPDEVMARLAELIGA